MTYSSSLALSRSQFAGSGRNSVSFKVRERAFGPISNTIILIVLACLLGLLYLTQVTKTNAYGYTINELQEQQTALQSKNADLQVDSARLQSLDRAQNSAVANSMVAVSPSGVAQ
ncbi:MAG TPA: hypothetical protein VGE30_00290 [Candidatus Saccharimonadales bacterium]